MSTAFAQHPPRITAALTQLVGRGANSARIGAKVAAAWQEIDASLNPVIGTQGVAALYLRCLDVCVLAHPWLNQAHAGIDVTLDLTAIRLQLGCQAAADAAAGGGAVLDAFWYRLADMVGPPLTEELIGSVWSRVLNNGAETAGEV